VVAERVRGIEIAAARAAAPRSTLALLPVGGDTSGKGGRVRQGGAAMSRFRLELVDGGLALLLACLAEVQLGVYAECCGAGRVAPAAFLLTLGQTLLVAGRRRFPLVTFFLVGGAAIAQLLLGAPITDFGTFGVLVAFYTVVARSAQWLAVLLAVLTPIGISASTLVDRSTAPYELLIVYVEFAVAWGLGEIVRHRRRQHADLAASVARDAAAAERDRIARELHDVVAHSLSLVSIQAGAARTVLNTAPDAVAACLASIETVSREAWAEMRRFLDADDADAGAGPEAGEGSAPGLHRLPGLIQQLEAAGLAIELVVTGEGPPLPAAADLCAYRLVQECLTNALRHAGTGRARVAIDHGRRRVRLEVANDRAAGRGDLVLALPRHGLAGMRERVVEAGGRLSVEHGADRFTVRAELPVEGR
jgi:signal transduction histidine kinase